MCVVPRFFLRTLVRQCMFTSGFFLSALLKRTKNHSNQRKQQWLTKPTQKMQKMCRARSDADGYDVR